MSSTTSLLPLSSPSLLLLLLFFLLISDAATKQRVLLGVSAVNVTATGAAATENNNNDPGVKKPNLLWIVTDQQRWDCLRIVQNELEQYKGKTKINTPGIDRLAKMGVLFEQAYSGSPSCTPARAVMRTGCSLQRTGLTRNKMVNKQVAGKMGFIREKINSLKTFEQVLVDRKGYQAESYGKWHAPTNMFYSKVNQKKRAIQFTQYSYAANKPIFSPIQIVKPWYHKSLQFLLQKDKKNCRANMKPGQQINHWSKCPYTPIRMDPRFGRPTNTPLTKESGFTTWEINGENSAGRDSLTGKYTPTGIIGDMAYRALSRLANQSRKFNRPFSLAVHFNGPHNPHFAPGAIVQKYWPRRNNLYVSPSINDPMKNSAYKDLNGRHRINSSKYGWNNPVKVKEVTAVYYAMIEEIDRWVVKFLDRLEDLEVADNTMIVFTSDHGEMLGAHGMRNKFNFLEESARVPLVISFQGRLPASRRVIQPVSHIDLFSTVLDYLGASQYDNSDGESLRRWVDFSSYNQFYDERAIVVELDERVPKSSTSFNAPPGGIPNFLIRKRNFKLMMPKLRDSKVPDMLYNLNADPQERNNLLGSNGMTASEATIGKAEHLRILLLEWMGRANGPKKYYSDKKYNANIGSGDYQEILHRSTWRKLDYWQSDTQIEFGAPVWNGKRWIQNEYVYIGRTTPGQLVLEGVEVVGNDFERFNVYYPKTTAKAGVDWIRIKVEFSSFESFNINSLDARVEIKTAPGRVRSVQIGW